MTGRESLERRRGPVFARRQFLSALAGRRARHPLARRGDDGLVEVVRRALGRDVKDRQAFNLVPEEVETNWFVVVRWPDVDDATANGNLRAVLDQMFATVPHSHESFDKFVSTDFAAPTKYVRRTRGLWREHLGN